MALPEWHHFILWLNTDEPYEQPQSQFDIETDAAFWRSTWKNPNQSWRLVIDQPDLLVVMPTGGNNGDRLAEIIVRR